MVRKLFPYVRELTVSLVLGLVLLLCGSPPTTRLWAQADRQEAAEAPLSMQRLTPISPLVIREGIAFACWPAELVGETTLTAIDLASLKVLWNREFGRQWLHHCRPVGQFLYCVTSHESSETEWLLRPSSGEVVAQNPLQRSASQYWHQVPFAHVTDRFLISHRIVRLADGQPVANLDFAWNEAFDHEDKLYTLEVRQADSGTHEEIFRRTDLATGETERTSVLPAIMVGDNVLWLGRLIGASDDRMILQYADTAEFWLICYDAGREAVLWKARSPCEIGKARFREDGLWECPCLSHAKNFDSSDADNRPRQPVLVDPQTGACRPDPAWRDLAPFVDWHAERNAVEFVQTNERFTLAVVNTRQNATRMILGMDSAS